MERACRLVSDNLVNFDLPIPNTGIKSREYRRFLKEVYILVHASYQFQIPLCYCVQCPLVETKAQGAVFFKQTQ